MIDLTRAVRSPLAPLFLFLLAFLVLLALMNLRVNVYDEAILLTGGRLVAEGAVPHRDFYANYGPAQFYILAALFKLFGPSFLAARIYDTLIRAAIVAVTYRMLASRTRASTTLLATTAVAAWMFGAANYLYPMFPTLLLALAGTVLLSEAGTQPTGSRRVFAAGALTGFAALFRYDVGFFILAAHGVGLLLIQLTAAGTVRTRLRVSMGRLLSYAAGTAVAFLPGAALMLLAGAGPGFVHDILDYSPRYYAQMRSLPFPGPAQLLGAFEEGAVYLPFLAVLIAGAALLWPQGREQQAARVRPDRDFLILMAALTFLLSIKGLVRVQFIHLLLAIVPATILLAFLADRAAAWPRAVGISARIAVLAALFAPLFLAAKLIWATARDPAQSLAGTAAGFAEQGRSGSVRARWSGFSPARVSPDMLCAASFLRAYSRPGERILSATMRHDKLLVNNVAAYFATDRLPATRWHHFDPGLQTRADVQQLIIGELDRRGTRWVLRDASWDAAAEPNASAISSGVHLLDRYLAANYRPVAAYGDISVWLKRGEPFAAASAAGGCR